MKERSFLSSLKDIKNSHPELVNCFLLIFAVSQFASLLTFELNRPDTNILGLFGYASGWVFYTLLGMTSYPLILMIAWFALLDLFQRDPYNSKKRSIPILISTISLSLILTLVAQYTPNIEEIVGKFFGYFQEKRWPFRLGGTLSHTLYHKVPYINLKYLFNWAGTALIATTGLILSIGYLFELQFIEAISNLKYRYLAWKEERKILSKERKVEKEYAKKEAQEKKVEKKKRDTEKFSEEAQQSEKAPAFLNQQTELPTTFVGIPDTLKTELQKTKEERKSKLSELLTEKKAKAEQSKDPILVENPNGTFSPYILPHVDLLNQPKKNSTTELTKELKQKADRLEETLMSFGIEAKVGKINSGPTITSFEVHPAVGVKVGKITTLEHDIALNLEAKTIRIIAPIPGKAAVGIEVPNKNPQEISFKELLYAFQDQKPRFHIPMLIGKMVNGDFVMCDLAKMPHLIIAGATGSGKSVCINSIIMSILMTTSPDDIRLLMIDPKKVELTSYSRLPHMLAPVITEPQSACTALNWLVKEMQKRYEILKLTGQRNIDSFNRRKVDVELEKSLGMEIPPRLPYYVGIIDELADLMITAPQDIETPIARIAQMARAVGIHLILATQRPSREVITGLIKANFPARIAFKVASRVNSQIILDEIGAETLLGNGDMLFQLPGSSQLLRSQGVYVTDEEIQKVVAHISKERPPQYLISSFDRMTEEISASSLNSEDEVSDSLFDDAKRCVLSTGNASTTFLQRKLKIGYARAASLMDELERKGIVGPQDGSKPRKIFFPKTSQDDEFAEVEEEF